MIRVAAAALTLAAGLGLLKGCGEADPGGVARGPGGPAAKNVSHPITFMVSWKSGYWMDITIIIDGEPKGPFERRDGGFERTIDVAPGKRVEVVAHYHKDNDPPPGPTACMLKWFNTVLPPGGYEHRQDGQCRAYGDVPGLETQG